MASLPWDLQIHEVHGFSLMTVSITRLFRWRLGRSVSRHVPSLKLSTVMENLAEHQRAPHLSVLGGKSKLQPLGGSCGVL